MKYLDEAGFSLSLPLSYTWSPKNHPLRVPKHWGNAKAAATLGHDWERMLTFYRYPKEHCV